MIDYNILSTGSKGNAVVIDKTILIDCGVPFKALDRVYRKLGLVLLTHEHGDHINKTTIKRLVTERPRLRFGCGAWMVPKLLECGVKPKHVDVYMFGHKYQYKGFCLEPVPLLHNVPNCGHKIHFDDGQKLFYATDTNSLNQVEAHGYDLYMLEANYGEEEIAERIRRKQAAGEYCHEHEVLKNHLSREKAEKWLANNMGPNSEYIWMHQHTE